MGIKGLNAVIADNAPNAIKALEIKSFFGRKVAIDASMSLYQFLIAVRQQDGQQLQNETGETTSHLMGMFYRTLRIVDNGIKPLYVFDGAPPKLKSGELAKRIARNAQASADAAEAKETGTAEDVDKFSRRTVRVTKQHNEEAKLLLKLMGIPYVEAPCEAEACCAQLAKEGKVYAAASEDMDTLCFNAPVLLRHLTFSEARKEPISEIQLSKALDGLGMNMDQFIDMCILLGCDYCDPIRGIGPKKAHDLILEHKNIETILENLKGSKYEVPAEWPYKDARELFRNPDVHPWIKDLNLEWVDPDIEGLIAFLCTDKGFAEDRVRSGATRLQKATKQKQQGRLDGFFKAQPKASEDASKSKRKLEDKKTADKNAKKAKTKGAGRGKAK
ncbi:Flap endonuclease 1 [Taphrina deformans PYCC 5710]|uniref:Flap endonuclease 1 n=1 Tax=Taphrina deformans (strain PYCC 5710 / ATCC 11124 / CBS 356.35 / IMI 108563 / JCM 9778 / NBRC 8474) TaxID=1097556 RepID=R4XGZ6_TAPDE|nr:Flap endonuclease 1 [Taphrina deformans PYCC 5710]|eukprot:CCG85153.1 Flap endonuclease 1 [Taphrina deformans PYCC 5710]